MFKRFSFFTLIFCALFSLVSPAKAATSPWAWTDLSGQLSSRQNRSIKAMAYANGYWYYTDSEDLWNGGQVYRYDGSYQTNITTDVRNAGLSRIDDIVSDGQSVLFLKNIAPRNNQFEILKYQNNSYSNLTDTLRSIMASNEGLTSISGRSNEWYIVTSKGRILKWGGTASSPYQISLPDQLRNDVERIYQNMLNYGYSGLQYCSFTVENYRCPVYILPIANNQWIFGAGQSNYQSNMTDVLATIYRYNGATFSDITSQVRTQIGTFSYLGAQGNGTEVLLSRISIGTDYATAAVIVSDSAVRLVNANICTAIPDSGGCLRPFNGKGFWTGTRWFFVDPSKFTYSVSPTGEVVYEGKTDDYFTAGATNNNGTVLLGGAVSDSIHPYGPSDPHTAKLAKATEGYVYTPPSTSYGNTQSYGSGNQTYTSAYGPTMYVQGNPSDFRVGNGGTFIYHVTATDPDGVDRIDLYVNDARIKTCYGSTCDYEAVYYTNGLPSRTVPFWARTTDKQGYSTDSMNSKNILTIDNYSNASAIPSSSTGGSGSNPAPTGNTLTPSDTINRWQWINPNTGTLQQDQSIVYTVSAQANQGLQRIEIWVNGSVRQTCQLFNATTNQTCSFTLVGSQYPLGTQVAFNARIIDSQNHEAWTNLSSVSVMTAGTSGQSSSGTETGSALPPATWVWSIPPAANSTINDKVVYHVGAWDADGISKIEILVNGTIRRTCSFPSTLGNVECSWEVYPQEYPNGTEVFVNAHVVDAKGVETWAASQSYRVQR